MVDLTPPLSVTPENISLLSPLKFNFGIRKIPNVNYWGTAINLPGLSLHSDGLEVKNPFVDIPMAGTKLKFSDLTVKFKVDEDLVSWLEIWDWMVGLGFPENFDQYKELQEQDTLTNSVYSDAILQILTNNSNVNLSIEFKRLFPVTLSELPFASDSDASNVTATATFKYAYYTFLRD